ncbi:23S rRNA (uracil(1939)-C(5))-methyltransferase RlmD [Acholeplasma equirhinis]|uniref:23S rRNA (uracil(1939)-C(5))-methyltransferase RlmD n=1 Tax=Acholeplasma equirhinis TaxID=555393 RepID=UPI00197AE357|nr:23S rRNA (uracil(1939)-C(5))-methyltransferase RlmD [Acholeplasma equirhinis]MBN3490313.1 23S rRNA (uracil(1939)-C(5))-methyltransferase RlmD [Acholeplasma equirhinis]
MYKNYNDDSIALSYKTSDFEKLTVEKQLEVKQKMVADLFGKETLPIIPNPKPKHYRHKAVLSAVNVKLTKNFQIRLGLYIEGSKEIKPRLGHFLHHPGIDKIFEDVEKLLIKYKMRAYHEKSGEGIIKHVMIRKSYAFNEYMVIFATQGTLFPNHKDFTKELVSLHPEIKTVIQNIHRKDTKLILLEEEKIFYGPGYIIDQIDDLRFQISSRAFYQVNPEQMMNLYHKSLEIAQINTKQLVLDCYSGIGTITLLASKLAHHVYGFEINDASVKDAVNNKKINDIKNVTFVQGDVENLIEAFDKPVDLLIMDPTREGASLKFNQALLKLMPNKILYISCDPVTQARDIKQLSKFYRIKTVQPVDMFTYTQHVESIVLLSLK